MGNTFFFYVMAVCSPQYYQGKQVIPPGTSKQENGVTAAGMTVTAPTALIQIDPGTRTRYPSNVGMGVYKQTGCGIFATGTV